MKRIHAHLFIIILVTLVFSGCKSTSELYRLGTPPADVYMQTIPMERSSELVVVTIEIAGKDYRFLLDTGAPMVISKQLSEELKMKRLAGQQIRDSNNQRNKLGIVELPELKIGGQSFIGYSAIEADLQQSAVIGCMEIDGILGANLMRHAVWKIDYSEGTVSFSDSDRFTEEQVGTRIPFTVKSTFTPKVDILVNGTPLKNVTFDTGFSGGLSLSKDKLSDFNAKDSNLLARYGYQSSGLFGAVPDTGYTVSKEVEVGGLVIRDMHVKVGRKPGKSLLGTGLFENYDLILDWTVNQAMLIGEVEPTMHYQSYGIAIMPEDDRLIIGSVLNQSDAYSLGIAFGDAVIAINGNDYEGLGPEDFCLVRELMESGEPLTIELEGKGEFELERTDYPIH